MARAVLGIPGSAQATAAGAAAEAVPCVQPVARETEAGEVLKEIDRVIIADAAAEELNGAGRVLPDLAGYEARAPAVTRAAVVAV